MEPAAMALAVSVICAPLAVVAVGLWLRAGRPLLEALVVGALVGTAVGLLLSFRYRGVSSALANVNQSGTSPTPDAAVKIAELGATAAELSPDALVLYAADGTIQYANRTARELFFEGNDPAGKNFLHLVGTAPPALAQALMGDSERLFTLEVEQQQVTFHLSRQSYPLGEQEVTLLVVRNLTREIARREVETLKNVVRVISHEVNNSLAPIASLVHSARLIAQRPEHSAKLGSVFDTIEERSKHLESFIDGYANLARLPAPRPRRVEWQPFLRHLRDLYPAARFPDVSMPAAWFDAVQIEQVLINLVKNALEAGSPEQGVDLGVAIEPDGSTRLEVRDEGPGFSKEALSNAFTPFFTTKSNGSGMGHALCREIVHAHGGTISLVNAPDGGAIVTLILPGQKPTDPRLRRSRNKLTLSRT
jgi:signal transduction histidine kinase